MSLKAKLEAVIYASEEPVTLGQLAGLFADEALELKAKQEEAAAEAETSAPATTEPLPLVTEAFDYLGLRTARERTDSTEEIVGEDSTETAGEAIEAAAETRGEPAAEATGSELTTEPGDEAAASEATEASPEEAAKQAARQRDREVRAVIRKLLDELIEDCSTDGRGIEIREIAGGYRMATKPEYHDAVRSFVKSLKPALKLSLPALETLAVIAYKQPVTAPEVNEIRGVDSSGVFSSLLARKLIATSGRKQVVGRPILYKTTKEFLLRFGLKDLSELPSMEEFEKIAASALDESDVIDLGEVETLPATEESNQDASMTGPEAGDDAEATPEPEAASTSQEAETEPSKTA
jgi:segregation and condensation protein B